MTSEQIFHILGMKNAIKILKTIDEQPQRYNEILTKFQMNPAIGWRLLLLLNNAHLIVRDEKNKIYYSTDLGQKIIMFSNEIDSPIRVSWDGGDIKELIF